METEELLASEPDRVYLYPHQILFSEGEAADVMYLLLDGQVELLVSGQTVGTAEAGTFVGELALIEPDEPRPYSVRSLGECVLLRIERGHFESIVSRQPEFAVDLMRDMADHLRREELSPA